MSRPSSVSIASWIWLLAGLFTTFTIANIVAATNVLSVFTEMGGTEDDLAAGEVIGWFGFLLATALMITMVIQVVAAVKLRDGARWARVLLSIAAFFSLLAVAYDFTLLTSWLLLAANVVALVLAYGQTASEFLESRPKSLVSV